MSDNFVILIVDDNPNNLFTLRTLLKRLPDYEVIEAVSGEEALARVLEHVVHLILLDVQMPGMDGFETARHLQMTERTRGIPIIFLSAVFKADEFVSQGYKIGAIDYLTKPIDDNALLNRIRLYQDIHRRESQLVLLVEQLRQSEHALSVAKDAAEAANRLNSSFLVNIFNHAHDGMVVTDRSATIVDVNPAFCRHTGYAREEAIGRNPSFLQSGRQDQGFYRQMWQSLLSEGAWQGEIWNRRKDGEFLAAVLTISSVPGATPDETRFVGIFTDITGIKKVQSELEHMVHFDALTHLPNRVLLRDRLSQAVARARRAKKLLAVCFIDLDGFKQINDLYGHAAGDQLLINVAMAMEQVVRGEDTVARLGGDEFVVLLTNLNDLIELDLALHRLIEIIGQPSTWGEATLQVSASIGITVFPNDAADEETLIRHADLAMYAAKQAGRNRFSFFDAAEEQAVRAQIDRQAAVRLALERNELVMYYQPKVHMRTGQIVGAEALIRWQHPQEGLKLPGQFLPCIEATDLIVDIGEWTLRTALDQVRAWRAEGLVLPVSVNISPRHLLRPDFVARIERVLAAFPDLPPHCLEIEILETSALGDMATTCAAIEGCMRHSVSFALDDFGTGYSSLVHLRNLPAKALKIDKSFVRDMHGDPHDLAIVDGVTSMGAAFGREVIAEGIETEAQGRLLLKLGCEIAQGYGIARPMPGEQFVPWARTYQPFASWQGDECALWRREDFSLLAAEVEHRYWFEQVLAAVTDRGGKSPVLDRGDCRFGRWYQGEGKDRYGHLTSFEKIDALHTAMHAAAAEALQQAGASQPPTAAQVQNLESRRDALLAGLYDLRQEIVSVRKLIDRPSRDLPHFVAKGALLKPTGASS